MLFVFVVVVLLLLLVNLFIFTRYGICIVTGLHGRFRLGMN